MYMANVKILRSGPKATYTRVGVSRFKICVEVKEFLAFLDTNMSVSPTQNCGGGCSKPTPGPNAYGFASQLNIGLRRHRNDTEIPMLVLACTQLFCLMTKEGI